MMINSLQHRIWTHVAEEQERLVIFCPFFFLPLKLSLALQKGEPSDRPSSLGDQHELRESPEEYRHGIKRASRAGDRMRCVGEPALTTGCLQAGLPEIVVLSLADIDKRAGYK
ncbi:Glycerophosphodiester Phosphodiesterase 1 [Manis pentadactyla]|nr:Glycerophosphodiester Phosphodiesterase 1 [Manis pentadactyla]